MSIDFWYGDGLTDVAKVSCTFYDSDCEYHGWMFNANGDLIGDYSSSDSTEIEKVFGVRFE